MKVEEPVGSKVGADEHPERHWASTTHRSLKKKKKGGKVYIGVNIMRIETYAEPESRITLKGFGGVPISREPK